MTTFMTPPPGTTTLSFGRKAAPSSAGCLSTATCFASSTRRRIATAFGIIKVARGRKIRSVGHLLPSPQAVDRLTAADIDQELRGKKASDHTLVWIELATA